MSVIETQSLSKVYRHGLRKVVALDDFTISIEEGEIFGLIGPNGAGKTTMMKLLLGLIYPTSGRAQIFGLDTHQVTARRELGFLPENPYFSPHLTGRGLLQFHGRLYGIERPRLDDRIPALLEQVGLAGFGDTQLRRYSRGMLQRVGIAQALLNDPSLVLFDEPMGGLDPIGRRLVRQIMLDLRDHGVTVLFCSHNLVDVENLCDRVAILAAGRLRRVCRIDELSEKHVVEIEIEAGGLSKKSLDRITALAKRVLRRGDLASIYASDYARAQQIAQIVNEDPQGQLILFVSHRRSLEEVFIQDIRESHS